VIGEMSEEYEAARRQAGLTSLDDRGLLAATGPQRQKFLHNLLSNEVAGLQPGQGRLAALMDVKGHLVALMRVLVDPDAVLLEMPSERLGIVEQTLVHYRVGAPVRFQRRPETVLALLGPQAPQVLAAVGADAGEGPPESHRMATVAGHPVRLVRAGDLPLDGFAIHVAPEAATAVAAALEAAGARPFGRPTLDLLRIEAGRPWYGPDIGEDNLLHETGLIAEYHSSSKGCYLGQEVMARLDARGANVNKRLRGLRLGAPAAPGAAVVADGATIGRLTTTGVSPDLGPIAMGYVHRGHAEPGTAVEVEGTPATVTSLPFER
jgi:folate-binding protein YgfZ